MHSDDLGFPPELDIGAAVALLRGVLLVHSRAQLARDHFVLTVTLPLALRRLYHILVPRHLQNIQKLDDDGLGFRGAFISGISTNSSHVLQ
jgi:hypothetical protein